MEVGDWITLGAVIVALGIGVASILYTQSLQKKERKEKLLNEIIEWATNILSYKSPLDVVNNPEWILEKNVSEDEKIKFIQIYGWMDLMGQLAVLQQRGEYIAQIASKIRLDLGNKVAEVIDNIESYLRVLFDGVENTVDLDEYGTVIDIVIKGKNKLRDTLSKNGRYQLKVFDSKIELDKSIKRIIEVAAKIKTLDIH